MRLVRPRLRVRMHEHCKVRPLPCRGLSPPLARQVAEELSAKDVVRAVSGPLPAGVACKSYENALQAVAIAASLVASS